MLRKRTTIQTHGYIRLACLLAALVAGPSLADEEVDTDARRCINGSILSTRVVDDSSILFYMRGKSIYHNILRGRCAGLLREGRFSYYRTTSSLCRMDSIRVLYVAGAGLQEGRSCSLGYFYEVTKDDAAAILDPIVVIPQPKPLPPAEPEEVIEEPDESLFIRG